MDGSYEKIGAVSLKELLGDGSCELIGAVELIGAMNLAVC